MDPVNRKREPVAEVGAEDYLIVRHTHDVRVAVGLMRAALLDDPEWGCPECLCDTHRWDAVTARFVRTDRVCLHKRDLGKPQPEWIRILPALPNSYAAAEGWAFSYQPAKPHSRGAFPAVVFQ